jgi:4-hydroxy-3-polyprenylbenzoate decarboxylase
VIGVGGSSGAIYARALLERVNSLKDIELYGVMSENARINWDLEVPDKKPESYPVKWYSPTDFNAPFASGSAKFEGMVVCPCSMGLLGRIANGVSNDLMTRAADVCLKERRLLILVPRETPLSFIHLTNMLTVTKAGAVVCPAVPSFYSQPKTIDDLIGTVVDRVLDLAKIEIETYRWGSQGDG